MGKRSKNAFSVEQSPLVKVTRSSSCASNAYDDREKESKNFKREDDFFTHKRKRFFFDFGPKILFSTMLVCPSFPPQQEEKKKILSERERETWQQKKERDFRFSLKRHAHKNHASSHITTGVLSSLRFSTTLFCDTTFRFRDKATKETTSSVFVPSFRDAVYTC